ncbi:hypothetical protein NDU88_002023 [Pleurodeles waltl]|uniref:Uncharacterized protein n=1 Tax=Pleurodeles waltl TaxID=8319 RepID=A0AAV7REH3_PLEWA|nr:hypothetical protein NDU88_002023 [Pleurodeles waltl]
MGLFGSDRGSSRWETLPDVSVGQGKLSKEDACGTRAPLQRLAERLVRLLLSASSANAPESSINAVSSVDTQSEESRSSFKRRWKREAVPQDYVADIEISLMDASILETLKMFLKELNDFPSSDVINITSIAVTTGKCL